MCILLFFILALCKGFETNTKIAVRMSDILRANVQRARDELKKAEKALADHKRNGLGAGAEWRGTWDNGHWCGHNSADLNKIYTNLYIKVQKAQENVETALTRADPYRRDLDATIERLKESRKGAGDKVAYHPLLDRLVMVIHRKMNYESKSDKYAETLCVCTHYFQGRKVTCDCIADELGFLSLSDTNEERLKNERVCFVGDEHHTSGTNWGKPVRGPIKPGKGHLRIIRGWEKKGKNLLQHCMHFHYTNLRDETREIVPCDCIKRDGFHYVNPENIYIKNDYYMIESNLPIIILRQYKITGVSHQGSDTLGFECEHYTHIDGCAPGDFSNQCDCQATGELSDKLKKFDARGLVEKIFYGTNLKAMAKITISRETGGLIPHPKGHSCLHERDDGCFMECDCTPKFNIHTVENFEDVVYELSEDMKKRQAARRVSLADDGKLQVGGFFKHVFYPSSSGSYYQKALPYDVDKYVVS